MQLEYNPAVRAVQRKAVLEQEYDSTCNHAKHMEHLALMVRPEITNTALLVNIVPPELEDSSITDPLLYWDIMQLAGVIHQPQGSTVADTNVHVVQTSIEL